MNKGIQGRHILLAAIVLLFFLSLSEYFSTNKKINKNANSLNPSTSAEAIQESVNKNLYLTDRKIELEQTQIDSQNKFLVPQVGQKISAPATAVPADTFAGSATSDEEKVYKDLKRDKDQHVYTPAGEVQSQVFEANRLTEQKQREALAFVQAYIDNAKLHGYKVRINQDWVVIGVDKINDNLPSGAH